LEQGLQILTWGVCQQAGEMVTIFPFKYEIDKDNLLNLFTSPKTGKEGVNG